MEHGRGKLLVQCDKILVQCDKIRLYQRDYVYDTTPLWRGKIYPPSALLQAPCATFLKGIEQAITAAALAALANDAQQYASW
jgi:hypothetical protein